MDASERLATLIEALLDETRSTDELASLDDDAIQALDAELVTEYQSVRAGEREDIAADDVAALERFRDARAALQAEQTRRVEAVQAEADEAAGRAEAAAALDTEMLAAGPEDEADPDESDAKDGDDADADAPVEVTVTVPVVPETAKAAARKPKRPSMAALAAAKRPAEAEPRPASPARTEARWRLQDGSQIQLEDKVELGRRMLAAMDTIVNSPKGFRDKVNVATFKVDRPDDMTIKPGADPMENQVKIDQVVAPAVDGTGDRALTASGGWCAPAEPRYDIPSFASAVRPLRDGLPRMSSTRGTVSFVRAARLSTILANQAGAAVTTWENATDQTPGESTKTRQTHACRTIQTEEVGAIVARMRFGNFQQRAFPEDVAHDLDLVAARHARIAERRLVDALISDVNIDVTQTGFFGTARDVRFALNQAAREIRYTERMGRDRAIRAAVESTVLDMIQSDVVNQTASGETDALLVDEAFARRLVALSTVDAIYMEDTPTGADEWVTNADTQALADYPDNFEIPIFPDGSVVFVDAGELNVGIVRDSTLNNTNDYEIFYETFEGLLWLGPYAKTLTLTTCPNGDSQLPVRVTTICSGS